MTLGTSVPEILRAIRTRLTTIHAGMVFEGVEVYQKEAPDVALHLKLALSELDKAYLELGAFLERRAGRGIEKAEE